MNCQEPIGDQLLESLRIRLAEAMEFNRADALWRARFAETWDMYSAVHPVLYVN